MQPLKILAIDDHADNLVSLKAVLADAFPDARVFTAQEGNTGIEIARREDPDVILLDIVMPGMDGYEVCRHLKSDEKLRSIPVVFLTALKTNRESRIRALEVGGDGFLSKPLDEEELIAQIRSMVKIKAVNLMQRRERDRLASLVAEQTVELEKELAERRKTEQELRLANLHLQESQAAMLNLLDDLRSEIDARKKTEEELRKRENLLNRIFDILPVGLWLADQNGKLFRTNEAGARIWGASPFVGQQKYGIFKARRLPSYEEIAPDDWALVHTIREGVTIRNEQLEIDAFDGVKRYILNSTAPVLDQDGNIEAAVVVNVDITDRKQHERELECVSVLSAALRAASNSAEMLPVILDQLLSMLDVEAALIAKAEKSGRGMVIELGRGLWAGLSGRGIPHDSALFEQAFNVNKPHLHDLADDTNNPLHAGIFGECQSVIAAPMAVGSQKIGALCIGSLRKLGEHDLNLLAAIADIAANAIHRATLHEQTENRLRQLTALRAIDQAISSSFDLTFILNTLVEQAALQLKADAVAVLLLNPATLRLEYAAGFGFLTPNIRAASLRLGEGQAGKAALERKTLSLPDLTSPEIGFSRSELVLCERFVSHHVTCLITKGKVSGVLEVFNRSRLEPDPEWIGYFEAFANQAAIAIDNAQLFEELQRANLDLSLAYDATIEGWSRAMDLRDHETEGHTRRVTELTIHLARRLGVDEDQLTHIRRGALLHDIGKLGVPDMILLKPSTLTPEERNLMQKHPQYAYDMLNSIEYLRPAIDIPYCHHEKWDGTGYPRGLKGEEIPFSARLFAVADVFDALTSDRPYRPAWSVEQALDYIRRESGKHFDPRVVKAFFSLIKEEDSGS